MITIFTGYTECNRQSETIPKMKLKYQYDGLYLTFTVYFGKGTDSFKEPVNIVFDTNTDNFSNLKIQKIFLYQKPILYIV
jgi:hypothetical protein